MTNKNPQEESLFDVARTLTTCEAQRAFLDQACGNDTDLRGRIEALLEAEASADEFFKAAAPFHTTNGGLRIPANGGEQNATEPVMDEVGSRIGRYKILQKIGEGGGGVVFMAEQQEPVRRRVAVKIIKLGMDTKSVIARFEAERQALALMDHLNIARVLDAGSTDTGRPYFVMELVRGIKITDYCDQNNLDTRQRLDLFVKICQAIQHAHQKGIIHRDIKPSNILVTLHDGVAVPKVIDFGIAKATEARLTDKTLFTAYEQVIGTPAYMSPEQAEMSGLDVDTRTDIYSLGVLLYELLTGRTPFDPKKLLQNGLDEMRRTLREQEPQRPSTMVTTMHGTELTRLAEHRKAEPPKLISLLKGDLDWIVMKSLEKDRRRRYETANGVAMDIQRYLNNEPVVARPPSRLYRFQKLVRRNKIIFAAGAAVSLALIIGLGASTYMFFMERAARQQAVVAEQRAEEARANEAKLRRLAEMREKVTQATVLVNEEKYDEADQVMSELSVSEPSVEAAAVYRAVGEWYALQGDWAAAAARFAELVKINSIDSWDTRTLDYLECGPALLELGATTQYENFRQEALSKFADAAYPFADRILKVSLLKPVNPQLVKALEPLANAATSSFATNANLSDDIFLAAWQSVSLGLMEYRRGNYAKAAEWCQRCLDYTEFNAPRTATAHVILAMASEQMKQYDQAVKELAQGEELINNKFKNGLDKGTGVQGFWFDWVFARILLREAQALVGKVPNT